MFDNDKIRFLISVAICVAIVTIFASLEVAGQRPARSDQAHGDHRPSVQPFYTEFKGVSLGMSTANVRAKLGEPERKADDQDFYLLTEKVTAQFYYDADHKVKAISVDYIGSTEAPTPRDILGEEPEKKPDGSTYKLIRYEHKGFWVSYYSSPNSELVTVTLQQFP